MGGFQILFRIMFQSTINCKISFLGTIVFTATDIETSKVLTI